MKGKKIRVEMGVLFLLPLAISLSPQKVDQSLLPRVLAAAAEYCRIFGNASLNYVCLEEITEVSYSPYRAVPHRFGDAIITRNVNHLLYDYQLVKMGEKIEEKRILLEENRKEEHILDAPLKVHRFPYRHIILGPMLVSEYWQQLHDYRIVGKEKFASEPCLVIEAVPRPGVKTGHLFGRIWISERDYQVLRLEWNQESIDNYEGIEERARDWGAKPRMKLVMEYAYVKKGIRFPSKYVFSEEYINDRGFLLIGSVLTVLYRNYQYFTVETKVDLKKGG